MDNNFQSQQNPQYQQPYGYQRPKLDVSQIAYSAYNVMIIVFIVLAVVSFLYYFILGIVDASDAYSRAFRIFLLQFADGVYAAAKYCFFAAVLAGLKKIINK